MGAIAMTYKMLWLLFVGCLFVGFGQGLGQFYRFCAVEISPVRLQPRAVTYVLSGGILAAFLGPISASRTQEFIGESYVGSFLTMALLGIINEFVVMLVNFPPQARAAGSGVMDRDSKSVNASGGGLFLQELLLLKSEKRSLKAIAMQPLFIISCTIATLSHTMMVMVMSNVTLAMTADGFGFSTSALVMELHFFAMFAPG